MGIAQIAEGKDPSTSRQDDRQAPTMAELCERYLTEHALTHKKASSSREDRRMIERFLLDRLGKKKVSAVTSDDIARLHHNLKDTPYQANHVRALLSKMFNLAEVWGLRPNHSNPTLHIEKYPEAKRERFLTDDEIEGLRDTLTKLEAEKRILPQAAAAVRLLLLTGCRLNEILTLRWEDVDRERQCLTLQDTKTGDQRRPIGAVVIELLDSLPWREESAFVIPGRDQNRPLINLNKSWRRIRTEAGLQDVRIHDLRHTHASIAVGIGHSLPIIGKRLGHTQAATTQRYAHLANDPSIQAANQVSEKISLKINNS